MFQGAYISALPTKILVPDRNLRTADDVSGDAFDLSFETDGNPFKNFRFHNAVPFYFYWDKKKGKNAFFEVKNRDKEDKRVSTKINKQGE